MEKLSLENIERQISEMWDAVDHIPRSDIDYDGAVKHAGKVERDLRERYRKQEAITGK